MKLNFKKILLWFDSNLLPCLAVILLFLIPLWPKIPLADLLPGYIVRLRLEDLLVFFTFIIYLIWSFRGKINWHLPTWQLVFANIILGAMSILAGLFIVNTIPLQPVHFGKSILHWARYIEYFFLAFVFFSSLQTQKQFKTILISIMIVVAAISLYGAGQKYLYWPLWSTMNREFSKGVRLYLTPHARVQSTFGGHYDFAAYLVLMLPFTLIVAWHAPKKWQRILGWSVHTLGLWSLIVSAARTSIIAYFVALTVLFTLDIVFRQLKKRQKVGLWLGKQFLYYCLVGVIVLNFGQDMIERFSQSLNSIEIIKNNYQKFLGFQEKMRLTLGLDKIKPPENSVAVVVDVNGNNSASSNVLTPTDSQPETNRPADVYVDVPDIKYTTNSAGETIAYEATRTWSRNAELYGLSMAIRLDTLWPNAIKALMRNPLLGSGYGTINKGELLNLFTEADSTDNNYLRTLGETGLLGFISFYGVIIIALIAACQRLQKPLDLSDYYNYAFIASLVGILINALYIDVFAASKVAFALWMLIGIFWALPNLKKPALNEKKL